MIKPKISFVMPTRNRDNLIGESIESIIKQTVSDWELIVIDDHSNPSDKTEKVIKSFSDERIKYFKLEDENGKGISAARNYGNMMAESEYLAVADSDDICFPGRSEETLTAFKKEKCDIVYGEIQVWDPETGDIRDRSLKYKARDFDLEHFKKYDYIPHPTVAYKRQIALDFPYNSFFRRAEDYDFLARVARYNYKFHFINEPLVKYREHKKSVMHEKLVKFNYPEIVQQNRGWKLKEK